jgi:hypothetical protein
MDPMKDRERELDLLFEAVVQPMISSERRLKRIDGAIADALGDAASHFRRSVGVQAFKGRDETVLRGVVGTEAAVVIEGVNLAAASARRDADALVSKLLRIREAPAGVPLRVVVGYVTSPGGLNGEADMRDWIMKQITDNVFDIVHEPKRFRAAALDELREAGLSAF